MRRFFAVGLLVAMMAIAWLIVFMRSTAVHQLI